MYDLLSDKLCYILSSAIREELSEEAQKIQSSNLESFLLSKDYRVIPIIGIYDDIKEDSFLAIGTTNDEIIKDAKLILEQFSQDSVIIKLLGEYHATKLYRDGSRKPMGVVSYDGDSSNNKSYIWGTYSFAFVEKRNYNFVKDKTDLKVGMVVEYYKDGMWKERKIENVDNEWDRFYKLIAKHNKLRYEKPKEVRRVNS